MKLKDKKCSIWAAKSQKINGVNVRKWEQRYEDKLWCFYQQHAGSASLTEQLGLTMWDSTERATFRINRQDVLPKIGDIIVFGSKIYDCVSVDDFQGYLGDITLTGEIADSQDPDSYDGLVIE